MNTITLYPAWREAAKLLLNDGLTFGSLVSRDTLIRLCGISPATSIEDVDRFDLEVLQAVASIKQHLLQHHRMYMFSSKAGQYTVAHPEDQTGLALDTGRKAVKKAMLKMTEGVSYIRTDMLTSSERARNADAQAKISQLGGMIKQQVTQIR
jgi:hypothetical protein